MTPRETYDRAIETFRTASRAYTAVILDYRARRITTDEYLVARRIFGEAQNAMDTAERTFLDTNPRQED